MPNKNQYFELRANKIHLVDSEDVVNTRDSVKWNIAKTKFICKTKELIIASGVMNPSSALTQEQARTLSKSIEYVNSSD